MRTGPVPGGVPGEAAGGTGGEAGGWVWAVSSVGATGPVSLTAVTAGRPARNALAQDLADRSDHM
ncbi:hypothetical protein DLE01_17515 [Streptomyces sp. FT05W]|nr:hypothetical protein DLE01_17515 [Streptomyces sp. FT05W]